MSSGSRQLAEAVLFTDEDGTVTPYKPGDTPPPAVAKRITNPAAWGEAGASDEPSRPAHSATKDTWVEYAVLQGMTEDQATSLTKEQLLQAFTG